MAYGLECGADSLGGEEWGTTIPQFGLRHSHTDEAAATVTPDADASPAWDVAGGGSSEQLVFEPLCYMPTVPLGDLALRIA